MMYLGVYVVKLPVSPTSKLQNGTPAAVTLLRMNAVMGIVNSNWLT